MRILTSIIKDESNKINIKVLECFIAYYIAVKSEKKKEYCCLNKDNPLNIKYVKIGHTSLHGYFLYYKEKQNNLFFLYRR